MKLDRTKVIRWLNFRSTLLLRICQKQAVLLTCVSTGLNEERVEATLASTHFQSNRLRG